MKIIVNTTFRDFDGSINDRMQINFLKSLKRQTFQDFILVATIFSEHNVIDTVRRIMGKKCYFIHEDTQDKYKFSISKAFQNGVDYGLEHKAAIIVDCSSDIILQNNFLEVVSRECNKNTAGISHPNIFVENIHGRKKYSTGKLSQGIDIRFFSLDMFKDKHVYGLLDLYPSYDYGWGIEFFLCGIGIKYAHRKVNVYMQAKVVKEENDRGGAFHRTTKFIRDGYIQNAPVIKRFLGDENIPANGLAEINFSYIPTNRIGEYYLKFGLEYMKNRIAGMQGRADNLFVQFLISLQWIRYLQKGNNLADYFHKHGYRNIALYGMSYIADTLLSVLKNTNINVLYGMDRNAEHILADVEVYPVRKGLPQVDAVVVCAVYYFTSIKCDLEKIFTYPIISLEEIFFDT